MTHTQTQGADGAGTKTAATAWLLKRLKAARSDSEAHPEGHSNRTFYAGQAIAYENVLSLLEDEESTPAPAATPGVPDSLREAFAAATDSPVFVHDFADPAVSSAPGCQDVSLSFVTPDHITAAFMGNGLAGTIDQARKDAVALAAAWNHVRALIAAQPAGQAGDVGADGWRVVRAVMRKLSSAKNAGGIEDPETCAQVLGNAVDAGVAMCREALAHRQNAPAPNSTRTGAAETEDAADLIRQVDAILRKPPEPVSHPSEAWCDDYADWHDAYAVARSKALAARPEAPSDAGWSREDLEAFVAREWPEGRSAGAAARELVRALGVRGLAPTLQRLLTDLLGQINFASTDRAQILADFANAAPEAARMAKIDSFERWNPRVFDPTPPSDPAPSGQAEG